MPEHSREELARLKTAWDAKPKSYKRDCHVAVIRLAGTIASAKSGESDAVSYNEFEPAITAAFSSDAFSAVALDIDISGGYPAETELLSREIRRQADLYQKPVYAFVREDAASGGYYLACAADQVFALPTSTIGSVGVIGVWKGYAERDKSRKIDYRIFTAGDRKGQSHAHKPLTAEDIAKRQQDMDDLHQDFIAWVVARRGDRFRDKTENLLNGDHWLGRRALALGLIDGLGDMKTVLPQIMKKNVALTVIKPVKEEQEGQKQDKQAEESTSPQESHARHPRPFF